MHAHFVLAHPEPNSFNGHLVQEGSSALREAGWTVSVSDLYGVGFDPCERAGHFTAPLDSARFDVQAEQRHASANGTLPAGIEYYLPLFFDETATLFDYLPRDALLLFHGDVPGAIADFWKDTAGRHKMLGGDRSRPVLPPQQLFLRDEEFFVAAQHHPQLRLSSGSGNGAAALPPPAVAVDRKADAPLQALAGFLDRFAGRVLLLAESPGRRETIAEYLSEYGLHPVAAADFAAFMEGDARFMLGVGPVSGGFMLPSTVRPEPVEGWAASSGSGQASTSSARTVGYSFPSPLLPWRCSRSAPVRWPRSTPARHCRWKPNGLRRRWQPRRWQPRWPAARPPWIGKPSFPTRACRG